jgi:L-malate glycosyltransferase
MAMRARTRPELPRTVVHIAGSFGVGGTERQLIVLLRGLDRSRWRPRVICFRKTGALLDSVQRLGVDPIEIALKSSLMRPNTALAILRVAARLRAEGADLVQCHDLYSVLLGVPAARLIGVPVIASRRDLGHHVTALQRPFLRLALRSATVVLANAATVGAHLERDDGISPAKLAIVPNGLDVAVFDAAARAPAAPAPVGDGGTPTVLTIARMTYPAKGHDDLLHAAALVRARADVRFVLIGDGPREPAIRRLASDLGLTDHIFFLGRRADVPALIKRADIVCHPSRMEGLPNAVMEAMAAARPIVATTAGGTPELVQDGIHALLVPPQSPAALAEKILTLVNDRARGETLGAAARLRIERQFSVDALIARVDSLYRSLLNGRTRDGIDER